MKWLEICVYTTDAGLDAVTFAFSKAGLDQVSIEESHERAMAFLNERVVYWDDADADADAGAEQEGERRRGRSTAAYATVQ